MGRCGDGDGFRGIFYLNGMLFRWGAANALLRASRVAGQNQTSDKNRRYGLLLLAHYLLLIAGLGFPLFEQVLDYRLGVFNHRLRTKADIKRIQTASKRRSKHHGC